MTADNLSSTEPIICPVRYTEGPDVVDIKLPSRWLEAIRGEVVEVTEDEAELLLALGWEVHPDPTSLEDSP